MNILEINKKRLDNARKVDECIDRLREYKAEDERLAKAVTESLKEEDVGLVREVSQPLSQIVSAFKQSAMPLLQAACNDRESAGTSYAGVVARHHGYLTSMLEPARARRAKAKGLEKRVAAKLGS